MATKQHLENKIARLLATRKELRRKKEPIDKALKEIYQKLKKLEEQLDKLRVEEIKESGIVDWELLLDATNDNPITYAELKKQAYAYSLNLSGYYPNTNQRALKIKLYKKNPERTVLVKSGIVTVSPYYKPVTDGFIRFGILEHTLSEHGVYSLLVSPNLSTARLQCIKYRHPSILLEGTLDEVLEYIQLNHYYQKKYKE